MHSTQEEILKLAETKDIGKLKLREIGEAIGEHHPQKVKHHLQHLIKKGRLKYDSVNKSISVVKAGIISNSNLISIPFVGYANCGEATRIADEQIEGMLTVSRSLINSTNFSALFAVKAVGNSLNQANIDGNGRSIDDGDYVIIDSSQTMPENNRYVLSIIDGLANIKKLIVDREHQQYILTSESTQEMHPIYIHQNDFYNYMISGRVVGVIKKPRITNMTVSVNT